MTPEQQEYLKEAIQKANDNFKNLYNGMMAEAMEEAESHGVHVYRDIDKTAFIEAVQRCMKSSVQREKPIRNCMMIFRSMLNKEVRNEDVK